MASPHYYPLMMARRLLHSSSQNNSTGSDDPILNPSTTKILLLLFIAFFLSTFISFCLRRCRISLPYPSPALTVAIPYNIPHQYPSSSNPPPNLGPDHKLMESLPNVKFWSSPLFCSPNQKQRECVICLSEFKNEETLLFLPCCAHLFHPQCIKAWLNTHTTCPLCRHSFTIPLPHHPSASTELAPSVDPLNLQGPLCRMESRWHSVDIPHLLLKNTRRYAHYSSPLWGTTDTPSSSHANGKLTPPHMKYIIMGKSLSARYLKRSTSDKLVMRKDGDIDGDGDGEGSSSSAKRRTLTKFASEKYGSRWAWRAEQEEQIS